MFCIPCNRNGRDLRNQNQEIMTLTESWHRTNLGWNRTCQLVARNTKYFQLVQSTILCRNGSCNIVARELNAFCTSCHDRERMSLVFLLVGHEQLSATGARPEYLRKSEAAPSSIGRVPSKWLPRRSMKAVWGQIRTRQQCRQKK